MDIDQLTTDISKKDIDVNYYKELILNDPQLRDVIVDMLCQHRYIMVYYHCYYILDAASQQEPKLFYPYWDQIVPLLDHKNSYHRSIAMTILANLASIDIENRFDQVIDTYIALINDKKFLTAVYCVDNLTKISIHKSQYINRLLPILLNIENYCTFTQKQTALLKYSVLGFIEELYVQIKQYEEVDAFILEQLDSCSPKTKKKAKLLRKTITMRSKVMK